MKTRDCIKGTQVLTNIVQLQRWHKEASEQLQDSHEMQESYSTIFHLLLFDVQQTFIKKNWFDQA